MTLDEVAAGVKENCRAWANEYTEELDAVSRKPEIARQIVTFIEEAARHPKAVTGKPEDAVRAALKLTGLSNFRFGLLTGLLLWKATEPPAEPTEPTEPTEPPEEKIFAACQTCFTSGIVCHDCGLHSASCTCGLGGFSPVKCAECDGEGWV